MPKFATETEMDNHIIGGSTFHFSGAKIESLGATEYTLGTIVVDGSGSVSPFWGQIVAAIKTVVQACRRNPRADNMLLRVVVFDDKVQEIHGFKPLADCNEDDYNLPLPGGTTALYDAAYTAIKASTAYGKQLTDAEFAVNAAVFVLTDGQNCAGKSTPKMVADALLEAKTSESLESIMPVLIGVGSGSDAGSLDTYLEDFKTTAGFLQYVAVNTATEKDLAKLGGFISQSISSQSKSLGSNGPSKALTF